ncbi:quinone oxidoreductase [Saccharospirillum sp. MSK14-1]|uniref:YhdH/YhfP family quinone oxidoreductase n=1 Tax=Saccharospirillum sp. MSK14-1 TaxID=1897632 RepID=UPI000D3CE620|nr:YhdH/YhfP family quinone oxidoreductase [Saccharospirillum sp. MSK14-1]PTY36143.1 quinone oxidoreductase [Saccharospirillum sp. MSK14-1]
MTTFRAMRIHLTDDGLSRSIEHRTLDDLPVGEVLIRVHYSSLNYKDALSANGHKGISRHYPHTPGIDAAGKVVSDSSDTFAEGTEVAVIGFDLGMNTDGGFADYIRVPLGWVMALPKGLSMADSMRLGTAGVTAAYALEKLLDNGLKSEHGPVLVTGATGGVGTLAVHLLGSLGYDVTAVTGKEQSHDWLRSLGASVVIPRSQLADAQPKALLADAYAGAIDTVGDITLVNILKSLKFGGTVAACGIVGGTAVPTDIYPFILRGVNLVGIASSDAPLAARQRVLGKFAGVWKMPRLPELCDTLRLDEVEARIEAMLAGQIQGRALIDMEAQ